MNKILVLFLICIILGGTFTLIYFKVIIPNREKELESFGNISISTIYQGKPIKTGYIIESNSGIIEGNTSYTYEINTLKENQELIIKNKNIDDQDFYETEMRFYFTGNMQRVDLQLTKPEPVTFFQNEDENILVKAYSKNFQDVDICLKWSLNYIYVRAINYTEIQKLEGFEDWDRCYDGDFSLSGNSQLIPVSYEIFGIPNYNDYINLSLIDKAGNIVNKRIK